MVAGFASCSSPHTTGTLDPGTHTFEVRASDALGNVDPSPASHTWELDTIDPIVTISDAPPSVWPVNYYNFAFSSNESGVTFTCQLDSGPQEPCTSADGIEDDRFAYNALSTYTVRATDTAGNVGTASVTWRTDDGLVLHYPWEQGTTNNTSLLVQRPSYSPDGATVAQANVGGWAGTALGSTIAASTYKATELVLTSSPTKTYAASMWVRTTDSGTGTLVSTAAQGGFTLSISGGTQLALGVFVAGIASSTTATLPQNRWVHVGVKTVSTPLDGLQLWVDGVFAATVFAPGAGFDANQATDMIVGNLRDIDLDDLRFYNRALTSNEMCTLLARGHVDGSSCIPLVPGAELDFEHTDIVDTGNSALSFSGPAFDSTTDFVPSRLGDAYRIGVFQEGTWGYSNLKAYAGSISMGRSFSISFDAKGHTGMLVDTTQPCGSGAQRCGISVEFTGTELVFFAGTTGNEHVETYALPPLPVIGATYFLTVVVTEQRDGAGNTDTITSYVSGKQVSQLAVGGLGDVYAEASDEIRLASDIGVAVDEFEFWPADLARDPELLCENGFDGWFDAVANACTVSAN